MTAPSAPAERVLLERAREDRAALLAEPVTRCLNCGWVLPGSFCSNCGQKAQSLRQPIGPFLVESFVEYFGFDGRTWRSMAALLFRPGALTVEYVEGRRRRSLSPLKLYLTATLLFFIALSLSATAETTAGEAVRSAAVTAGFPPDTLVEPDALVDAMDARMDALAEQKQALEEATAVLARLDAPAGRRTARLIAGLDSSSGRLAGLRARLETLPDTVLVSPAPYGLADSTRTSGPSERSSYENGLVMGSEVFGSIVEALPDAMKGDLARDLEAADTRAERVAAMRAGNEAILAQVPTAMFAVLPLFALLLKLLYLGGGGVEARARRRRPAPPGAPDGASRGARVWATGRNAVWRVRAGLDRWAARRRIRVRRRPWRRAVRRLRAAVSPRRVRVARVAWLRRAVTARRTRYYAEHVVFTLHIHAFVFFVFLVLVVLPQRAGVVGAVQSALALSIPVYFLLAQRRVYAQTWGRTLAKAVVLGIAYIAVLSWGGVVAAALAARMG